jgi:hypothetical protein
MIRTGKAGGGRSARSLVGVRSESDPRLSRFVRGLALGALVGAAIAGSAFWRRGGHLRKQSGPDNPQH